ncbi:MAG: SsrA-binding protein [Bacteroidetes bacterium]|nr:SsrA-binding protein [Bacteroidota bacterium]
MNDKIVNKKAYFEYEILDKYTAGLVLLGTEVKSIRTGNVNIGDAYCVFSQNKLILKNLHISVWKQGSYNNHEPLRDRALLLNKLELKKLQGKIKKF